MRKFYYILVKEFLQVIRDLPGLGLLFLMPAIMLIVITLTQEKVMIGMDSDTKVILVNSDMSTLGNSIEHELQENPNINLDLFVSAEEAEEEVFRGNYQILVIVPDSATEKLERMACQNASNKGSIITHEIQKLSGIRLLYDPAMMMIYKEILSASLHINIESIAMEIYMETYREALQNNISDQFDLFPENFILHDFELELPDFPGRDELINIEEDIAGGQQYLLEYSIVKNNVPAFILFAMFFIVIPLAGSILNEKQQGTKDRIMTLPVTWLTLFSGKTILYLLICIIQFIMMILIGKYILPMICSLPPLSLDVNIFALIVITIASGLAAIGFGLMIGTFSSTYLQAAPIGSVLVVILAILGGIFVPNYMVPDLISKISMISPLRWGTDAFYSIFARNAGVEMVLKQLIFLLAFFITAFILSLIAIRRHP